MSAAFAQHLGNREMPDTLFTTVMSIGVILLFAIGVYGLLQHRMISLGVILIDLVYAWRLFRLTRGQPFVHNKRKA